MQILYRIADEYSRPMLSDIQGFINVKDWENFTHARRRKPTTHFRIHFTNGSVYELNTEPFAYEKDAILYGLTVFFQEYDGRESVILHTDYTSIAARLAGALVYNDGRASDAEKALRKQLWDRRDAIALRFIRSHYLRLSINWCINLANARFDSRSK